MHTHTHKIIYTEIKKSHNNNKQQPAAAAAANPYLRIRQKMGVAPLTQLAVGVNEGK